MNLVRIWYIFSTRFWGVGCALITPPPGGVLPYKSSSSYTLFKHGKNISYKLRMIGMIYGLYRYVPRDRVCFLRFSVLK